MSKVLKPLSFVLCLLSSKGEGQRTDDKRQRREDFGLWTGRAAAPRPPSTGKMPVVPVAGETPATPILGARRAGRVIVKRRERRFPERCPLRGSDTPVASRFSERQFPLRRQRMWMDMPSLRRITELEVVLTRQPGGRSVGWSGLPVIVPPFTALTRV